MKSLNGSFLLREKEIRQNAAEIVGETDQGNTLLKLERDTALGPKGTTLELPKDGLIFKRVLEDGQWELEESKFLAEGLKRALSSTKSKKCVLIDIGANTGLITLQAMNLAKTSNEVHLFEPVPRHVQSIKNNIEPLRRNSNINVHGVALSDRNGSSRIYIETSNQGNSSLLASVVPYNNQAFAEIELVETSEFFRSALLDYDRYVIKCDTQGMDALILSRIPSQVWEKVECALIEVWALEEIQEIDVRNLVKKWNSFSSISWISGSSWKVSLDDVQDFWLSKTGFYRNLYLSRN
jgi:FkbM family methyltransferase